MAALECAESLTTAGLGCETTLTSLTSHKRWYNIEVLFVRPRTPLFHQPWLLLTKKVIQCGCNFGAEFKSKYWFEFPAKIATSLTNCMMSFILWPESAEIYPAVEEWSIAGMWRYLLNLYTWTSQTIFTTLTSIITQTSQTTITTLTLLGPPTKNLSLSRDG